MNKTKLPIFLIILMASVLVLAGEAGAATLTVTNTFDSGQGSLREATEKAVSGDTINFAIPSSDANCASGSCVITLTAGDLSLDKNLTIVGPGARALEIRQADSFRLVFEIFNYFEPVSLEIRGVTVSGGAIGIGFGSPAGSLNLSDVTIRDNAVGIYQAAGSINLRGSTVSHNINTDPQAFLPVGGIYSTDNLTVSNSTISGNTGFYAGGILNIGVSVSVTNSTISNNTALFSDFGGGGICQVGGPLTLRNTIVAGNMGNAGPDIFGGSPIVTYGSNVIGNNLSIETNFPMGGVNVNGDYVGMNAMLGPLQNNGGQTDTHALLAGSPGINNGNNCVLDLSCSSGNPPASLVNDQRGQGFARRDGKAVDIGSFEVKTATASSPADMIRDLVHVIQNYDPRLQRGMENALIAKLNAASASLAAGDTAGALASITAFKNQVRAQTGKAITDERAEQLTIAAKAITAALK
jgi:hypothetical protein